MSATTTTMQLPPGPDAPGRARRGLRELCPDAGLLSDALLLVSETVTNAVVHGDGGDPITVDVDCADGCLTVAVTDHARSRPCRRPGDAFATGGRGLLLLDALATRWGVDPSATPPGNVVWFRLERPFG